MTDHRFTHGSDTVFQGGQQTRGVDEYLVMVGIEVMGNDVGIFEFITLLTAGFLESDRERVQSVLTLFSEQTDDQAGIQSARQQHTDRYVGNQATLDGFAPALENTSVRLSTSTTSPTRVEVP